jgi:GT2 family glycosyltransferase
MSAAVSSQPKISVIVPTKDRPESLESTLRRLADQAGVGPSDYEVIVVDDGSVRPATPDGLDGGPEAKVLRLEGTGPSAARNHGASAARGELLVFVDDDIRVGPTFLASHWQAHLESPGALQMGFVRLPDSLVATPFGRFRQSLEHNGFPQVAGPVETPEVLIAANMAVERATFERLGGFDPDLTTGEDQDLGLRHAERGGTVVYVPAAAGVHHDRSLDVAAYCRRAARYMEDLVRFGRQHPGLWQSAERAAVNGPLRLWREPASLSAKKILKSLLIWSPVQAGTLRMVRVLERIAPHGRLLEKLYRALLGAHLQRGYRRGLRSADA